MRPWLPLRMGSWRPSPVRWAAPSPAPAAHPGPLVPAADPPVGRRLRGGPGGQAAPAAPAPQVAAGRVAPAGPDRDQLALARPPAQARRPVPALRAQDRRAA